MPGPRSSVAWAPPTIFHVGCAVRTIFSVRCAMRTIFGGGSLCQAPGSDALPRAMFPRTPKRPVRRLLNRSRPRAPPRKPNSTRTRPMDAWGSLIHGRAFERVERGDRT